MKKMGLKSRIGILLLGSLLYFGMPGDLAAQNGSQQEDMNQQSIASKETVDQAIKDWPTNSREVAQTMISRYGLPNIAASSMLQWDDNGPWKKTIVYRESVDHNFPIAHDDIIEQVINLDVPVEKIDDLTAYDGSIAYFRTKGELHIACNSEAMNFLTANLAYEIASDKRSVEDARAFHAQTAANMKTGEDPEYTKRFMFTPPAESGDPGKAEIGESIKGIFK